ncbi:MAG: IS66 family insertion sequence element accessory protein TnpB [Acetatifactor sp.]|nr:IS66 family insertion sequence element accessory protein TnpB [Acetatifactor sp.]
MSDQKPRRTKDEWLDLIRECRKSGMTDAQWCLANGISHHSFNSAIKRLRKCSYAIPSRKSRDIYDLTAPVQDVVKVDIVPDVRVPREVMPEAPMHIDNSHMIEITFGDTHISISNGADPVLVTKTLSILRSYS